MKIRTAILSISLVTLLQACGGAESAGTMGLPTISAPRIQYYISYDPTPNAQFPAGEIQVGPSEGHRFIGENDIVKVELLLFGYDSQVLLQANLGERNPPANRYGFRLPDGFVGEPYPCGTGMYLSEVRVTDSSDYVVSRTFEICPGEPLVTDASSL